MRSVLVIISAAPRRVRSAGAVMLAVLASAACASSAVAKEVNIVSQGEPPESIPAKTHYFKTIQAAVDASKPGDCVLIEPGTYDEAVKVTRRSRQVSRSAAWTATP